MFKVSGNPFKKIQKHLSLALCFSLLGSSALIQDQAQAQNYPALTGDVSIRVAPSQLNKTLPIPGASRRVTMNFHGVSIADALRALGRQGGFNVLVDGSVQGDMSVDLNNVTIQDALETFRKSGKLAYSLQGGCLAVATADSTKGQSFNKATVRIFPLKHANSVVMASFFNQSIFADKNPNTGGAAGGGAGGAGGGSGTSTTASPGQIVTADPNSNSLIVVGTPSDISTVEKHLPSLDMPREMRTWRLSHANVLDVASIIASSLFNEGQPSLLFTSGSSSSGSGGSASTPGGMPSSLRVASENLSEGNGAASFNSGSSGGGSGGGGGGGGSGSTGTGASTGTVMSSSVTLRAKLKMQQNVQISPKNAIIIPDTRLNALTLLGTAEQIQAVEDFLPTLDRKAPQVLLETSLVEVSELGRRELGFNQGSSSGIFSSGINNVSASSGAALVNTPQTSSIGIPTSTQTPLQNIFSLSTNPLKRANHFFYQLNALASKNKAKMLANPSTISTSDTETMVSIVDEIIKSVTTTQASFGGTPTVTDNIGEAGIILNILPRVGADGTINLRVRPIVSSVAGTQRDRFNNVITLVSKREALTQNAVIRDGETFVIGGLIQDTNSKAVSSSPILSSLPIVGALARNSVGSKSRSELLILITPHIIVDETAPPLQTSSARYVPSSSAVANSMSNGGMVPVSLTPANQAPQINVLPSVIRTPVLYSSQARRSSVEEMPSLRNGNTNGVPLSSRSSSRSDSTPGNVSDDDVRSLMNKFR
jgi:type II secretory pathway component GspD/PulD (secretin)